MQKQLERARATAAKQPDRKDLAAVVKRLERQVEAYGRALEKFKTDRPRALEARNAEELNSEVKGFAVAGADQKFVWANAKIVGKDKVVVHSSKVKAPVAVRFAWEDYPVCNLFNREGLPACPFRTDDFPMVTAPKPEAQK